jgi:hypothetical protein
MALKKSQASLKKWTKQKWRTKSGKPSTQGKKATGERYLPTSAIKSLSAKEPQAERNGLIPKKVNSFLSNQNALLKKQQSTGDK